MNMRPSEQFEQLSPEQRQSLDWTRSIAIRANAGSGKTTVLVQRIVQILHNDHELKLDQIVAITFTRKAAAQLKQRLYKALTLCSQSSKDEADRQFWQARIDELPRCAIGTIDSLCHRLLKEGIAAGMVANLDPAFGILDGIDRSELLEMAIRRTEIELKDTQSPAWENWLKTQGRFELNSAIRTMLTMSAGASQISQALAKREGLTETALVAMLSVPSIAEPLRELATNRDGFLNDLRDALNEIRDSPPKRTAGETVRQKIAYIGSAIESADTTTDFQLLRGFRSNLFTKGGTVWKTGLEHGGSAYFPKLNALQKAWEKWMVDFDFEETELDGLDLTRQLIQICKVALRHFIDLCREENRYDYNFLAQRVVELLADRKSTGRLTAHYRYILVDEFQDTNEQQWQIVAGLAGVDPAAPVSTDKLMIVGDPQQSIYRFRQADPTVFERIIGLIKKGNATKMGELTSYDQHLGKGESTEEQRSGLMRLKKNFRSCTPLPIRIIDKLSMHAFKAVKFGDPQHLEAGLKQTVEYTEVVYIYPQEVEDDVSDSTGDDAAVGETTQSSEDKQPLENLDDEQLELVALELIRQHSKGIAWREMAILLRSRKAHLVNLEEVLQKSHIPYQLVGGLGFWQRQEVRDLVCLANCLANGADELALFAVLRGPLCGLDDSELLFLSMLGGRKLLGGLHRFAMIQEANCDWGKFHLDEATDQSLRKAFAHLDFTEKRKTIIHHVQNRLGYEGTWRRRVDRVPHSDLLMIALDESGAWGVYTEGEEGERRLANLKLFFDEVRLLESNRNASLADTARRLKTLVDESTKDEQAELTPEASDAVQVMTVHAAKGLEFSVVAVIGLERRFNSSGESLMILDRFQHFRDDNRDGELAKCLHGLPVISFRDPEMPLQKIKPLMHQALNKIERDLNVEEEARIFHVAITRAERVLILAGAGPKAKNWPPKNSWQKWIHEALGLEREIDKDSWQDPLEPLLRMRIIRDRSDSTIKAVTSPKPEPEFDLQPLREAPRKRTIAVTSLEKMLKLYHANFDEWEMRYRHHVQAHIGSIPKSLIDGTTSDSGKELGKHVGTLVHRALEMGTSFPREHNERRALLVAHAAALVDDHSHDPDEPGNTDQDSARSLPEVIAIAALSILAKVLPNNPFKDLLEAEGEAEVDFALPIGDWIITGRFDRLIRRDGCSWEIVDWKTDDEVADAVVQKYRPQMKLYALALYESLSVQERPPEVVVHLAMTGPRESRRLNFDPDDLGAYRNELERELPRV